jgi:hypothetical protein
MSKEPIKKFLIVYPREEYQSENYDCVDSYETLEEATKRLPSAGQGTKLFEVHVVKQYEVEVKIKETEI